MAEVLGHIDCPACGTKGGMRITPDKNGDPFGFCEATCNAQLRIGGNPVRVREFVKLYPWAGKKPVTGTEPQPVAAPAAKPVQEQEQKQKPARVPFGLHQLMPGGA